MVQRLRSVSRGIVVVLPLAALQRRSEIGGKGSRDEGLSTQSESGLRPCKRSRVQAADFLVSRSIHYARYPTQRLPIWAARQGVV